MLPPKHLKKLAKIHDHIANFPGDTDKSGDRAFHNVNVVLQSCTDKDPDTLTLMKELMRVLRQMDLITGDLETDMRSMALVSHNLRTRVSAVACPANPVQLFITECLLVAKGEPHSEKFQSWIADRFPGDTSPMKRREWHKRCAMSSPLLSKCSHKDLTAFWDFVHRHLPNSLQKRIAKLSDSRVLKKLMYDGMEADAQMGGADVVAKTEQVGVLNTVRDHCMSVLGDTLFYVTCCSLIVHLTQDSLHHEVPYVLAFPVVLTVKAVIAACKRMRREMNVSKVLDKDIAKTVKINLVTGNSLLVKGTRVSLEIAVLKEAAPSDMHPILLIVGKDSLKTFNDVCLVYSAVKAGISKQVDPAMASLAFQLLFKLSQSLICEHCNSILVAYKDNWKAVRLPTVPVTDKSALDQSIKELLTDAVKFGSAKKVDVYILDSAKLHPTWNDTGSGKEIDRFMKRKN